jgi:hypothetical protein
MSVQLHLGDCLEVMRSDAFAQFEVYGRWVRICCKDCGMSSATVPAQKAYDASAAAQLWNKRVENDKPA